MIAGLSIFDLIGLAWFLAAWLGYGPFSHLAGRRWTMINTTMIDIRRGWMETMLARENRMLDAVLIGHVMSSASFFASTTVVVMAALLGALGSIEHIRAAVQALAFTDAARPALDIKLVLVLVVVIRGFLSFTWSIRQFNYAAALIGSAPPAPVEPALARALATDLAEVMSLAALSFNGGIRAYYFALAALTWLVSPILFALATAGVVVLLLRRQTGSRMAGVLQRIEAEERTGEAVEPPQRSLS